MLTSAGHRSATWIFRIMREFPLWKEKARLQFIGEAFNLFNHTNISSVDGTAFNYQRRGSRRLHGGLRRRYERLPDPESLRSCCRPFDIDQRTVHGKTVADLGEIRVLVFATISQAPWTCGDSRVSWG